MKLRFSRTPGGETFSFFCCACEQSEIFPDAGRRNFFLFLFRLRTVRTSKFSALRLWQRTDRCLIPWHYEMLYAVALAGTFWGFQVSAATDSEPQILGDEQKIKKF